MEDNQKCDLDIQLTSKGYSFDKKKKYLNLMQSLQKDLIFKIVNKEYFIYQNYNLIKESNERIYVPQQYGISRFGYTKFNQTGVNNYQSDQVIWKDNLILKDQQIDVVDQFKSMIKDDSCNCQLNLHTGFGKTIVALYIIAKIVRGKTLILVHKNLLLEQWIQQITKCIKDVKIGIIQGNQLPQSDTNIDIAMIQTLTNKKQKEKSNSEINLNKDLAKTYKSVVIDEMHHYSSQEYIKLFIKYSFPYVIGLSATPQRKDGLDYILKMFMGENIITKQVDNRQKVDINIYSYSNENFENVYMGKSDDRLNLSRMITDVCNNQARTQYICDIINKQFQSTYYNNLFNKQPIHMLILTERRSHVDQIYKNLKQLNEGEIKVLKHDSKSNQKIEEVYDIIVSTYQLAQEGFDCPYLNTVLFASPKVSLKQSIGRVLRKQHIGINPTVIDIYDKNGVFNAYYNKRRKLYNELSCNIKHCKL